MELTEPTIITEGLPSNYRIIADEQDGRFYPQRQTLYSPEAYHRFATRRCLDGGSSYIDHPLSFETEQEARDLIEADSQEPQAASWGSIIVEKK